uniref:Crinkler (CRN) family protein n=1 Tax=Globodera pallida TaxID=36090 RepID=A0A183BKV1_GLOPA
MDDKLLLDTKDEVATWCHFSTAFNQLTTCQPHALQIKLFGIGSELSLPELLDNDGPLKMLTKHEKYAFQNFITGQLNILSRKVRYFTDPRKPKTVQSVNDLLEYCKGDNGVEKMADYINQRVTEGCMLTNTLVFVKIENLWLQIEKKFNVTEWNHHEKHLKRRIRNIIYSMPSSEGLGELELVERKLPDAVFNGNLYDRVKISFFGALIQIELGRLMLAANLCGNFTFNDNKAHFDQFLFEVTADVTHTSQFLVDYMPKKLNMSSSGVEDLIVSKTIEDYPGGKDDIPSIRYYRLGAKIHENLKHVGLPRIEKQVLVAPSENSDATFTAFYVCPHYWCSTVLGQRGVDLMVARFIKHHIFDAWSLKKRLQRIKPAIVETLKFDYYVSLPRLVNELEEIKKVKLVAEWQQSAAIVRQKTPFLVNCLFPTITVKYRRESPIDHQKKEEKF